MVICNNLSELSAYLGKEIGATDWVEVSQGMIDDFARATGDFQWIHCDIEKCKRESPFKTTIAHGHLTLSLLPRFMGELLQVNNIKMMVNYGLNQVRFTNPVPSGARVKASLFMKEFTDLRGTGAKVVYTSTIDIEGEKKSACKAESVVLYYV